MNRSVKNVPNIVGVISLWVVNSFQSDDIGMEMGEVSIICITYISAASQNIFITFEYRELLNS